jgi:hypothetical protein
MSQVRGVPCASSQGTCGPQTTRLFASTSARRRWNQSHGLANLMLYDIDVAPSSTKDTELIIAGGTQENASVMTEIGANGSRLYTN